MERPIFGCVVPAEFHAGRNKVLRESKIIGRPDNLLNIVGFQSAPNGQHNASLPGLDVTDHLLKTSAWQVGTFIERECLR